MKKNVTKLAQTADSGMSGQGAIVHMLARLDATTKWLIGLTVALAIETALLIIETAILIFRR